MRSARSESWVRRVARGREAREREAGMGTHKDEGRCCRRTGRARTSRRGGACPRCGRRTGSSRGAAERQRRPCLRARSRGVSLRVILDLDREGKVGRTELVVLLGRERAGAQLCEHGGRGLEGVHDLVGVLLRGEGQSQRAGLFGSIEARGDSRGIVGAGRSGCGPWRGPPGGACGRLRSR